MRLICVITLTLLIFRWVLDFREICARLMWGIGSTSPFDFNINIRWSFSCSVHRRRRLIPQRCSSWHPLIGGREGHRFRLDGLENWRIFYMASNWNMQLEVPFTWSLRLPVALNTSPVCRVQYVTMSKINVTNNLTPKTSSLFDAYMSIGC